jgi:hypothetical protein
MVIVPRKACRWIVADIFEVVDEDTWKRERLGIDWLVGRKAEICL